MKIAVLICGLMFDSQKQTIKGILRGAMEHGDRCYIFCSYGIMSTSTKRDMAEYTIFTLPDFRDFDGVIYVKNTIYSDKANKRIIENIKAAHVPCVVLNQYEESFVNIGINNKSGMKKIMEHLIAEHHFKNIYFITGPKFNVDSVSRYEAYVEELEEHGLPYDEKHVFHGDYKPDSGRRAVEAFLTRNPELPEAIVCANDNMAIGAFFELQRRGIKVPEQVALTGVDYGYEARVNSPQITSLERPQQEMGNAACEILHHYSEYNPGCNIEMQTRLVCTESCGCKANELVDEREVRQSLIQGIFEWGDLSGATKRVTTEMVGIENFTDLFDYIGRIVRDINPEQFYLCLCDQSLETLCDDDFQMTATKAASIYAGTQYTEQMTTGVFYNCGKLIDAKSGLRFKRRQLLPLQEELNEGDFAFFIPVHYMEKCFGYTAIVNSLMPIENDLAFTWNNSIAIAQENINKHIMMQRMIAVLDRMWIYDTLTGLYNRAGFFKLSQSMLSQSIKNNEEICIIFMDVDGLKIVNDEYGHEEGDCLLKSVAKVLASVAVPEGLLMRYGGDEFVAMVCNYDLEAAKEYEAKIYNAVNAWNETSEKPYLMKVSLGCSVTQLNDVDELDRLLEEADREMYRVKRLRRGIKR